MYVDTGSNGCSLILAVAAQKRGSQIAAATAAGRYTELSLQVAQGGGSGGYGFLNLAVGNGIADTNKHDGFAPEMCFSIMRFSLILRC